ncbi:hypothetical protein MXB_5536, partial [Myxobolus squamalis]
HKSLTQSRHNSHTFIDRTVKITPQPIFQCVIVMIYDCGTDLYILCTVALVSKKNMYCEPLYQLLMLIKYLWKPL